MIRSYRFLGFKHRVKHCFLALAILCVSLVLPVLATAEVTVGELTQISSTRVSRVEIEFTYRVEFINTGGAVGNVSATVTSNAASTTITEGALTFPNIAAGGSVSSTDTFTIRQDRRFSFDPNTLVFNIQSTLVSDVTPPQLSIVSPASGALVIKSRPAIEVQATDDIQLVTASLALTANGQPLMADCLFTGDTAQCLPTVDLPEGAVILVASVDDAAGNTGSTRADFVVTLGTVDIIGQLYGMSKGQCVAVSESEYQQENIIFLHGKYIQEYINSGNADCSSPWSKVIKEYSFSLTGEQNITLVGALLNLQLSSITLTPYVSAVVESLNKACNKKDFVMNSNNSMSGAQCQGGVQYPAYGVFHYELIKRDGSNIILGNKLDVDDVLNRATQLSTTRIFSQVNVTQ